MSYKIHTILKDNSIQLTEQPRNRDSVPFGKTRFDMICEGVGFLAIGPGTPPRGIEIRFDKGCLTFIRKAHEGPLYLWEALTGLS